MGQSVMQKGWFAIFKVKVTAIFKVKVTARVHMIVTVSTISFELLILLLSSLFGSTLS